MTLNANRAASEHLPAWPLFTFLPFLALMLLCDSRLLLSLGHNWQFIPNLLVPLYLLAMLVSVRPALRLMMLLTVPYSLLGEVICSDWLRLYSYKFLAVPIYVPFGHAIVFSTGFLLAHHSRLAGAGPQVRLVLIPFYLGVLALMALVGGDNLSLVFGAIFFAALAFKGWQPFYLLMGLVVLTVELAGTGLGCWAWRGQVAGIFTPTNPPAGAIVFYILGDILVVGTAGLLQGPARRLLKVRFS